MEALVLAASTSPAQGILTTPQPTDPKELLKLAMKLNGLAGDNVEPWHLRASFVLFDENGNQTKQWAVDELWINPQKFQRKLGVETTAGFSGVEDQQFNREYPEPAWPFGVLTSMWLLFDPSAHPEMLNSLNVRIQERTENSKYLRCFDLLGLSPKVEDAAGKYYSFCFDSENALASISLPTKLGVEMTFLSPVQYQGRTLPTDVEVHRSGKVLLRAHLDEIEMLTAQEASGIKALAQPAPSSGASGNTNPQFSDLSSSKNMPPVEVPSDVANGLLLKKVDPIYPGNIQGTAKAGVVVIRVVVGKLGTIESLHVLSGDRILYAAALNAVKQWQYKPYLQNGVPVAFQTTISINFELK